jgi:hypothetical protein
MGSARKRLSTVPQCWWAFFGVGLTLIGVLWAISMASLPPMGQSFGYRTFALIFGPNAVRGSLTSQVASVLSGGIWAEIDAHGGPIAQDSWRGAGLKPLANPSSLPPDVCPPECETVGRWANSGHQRITALINRNSDRSDWILHHKDHLVRVVGASANTTVALVIPFACSVSRLSRFLRGPLAEFASWKFPGLKRAVFSWSACDGESPMMSKAHLMELISTIPPTIRSAVLIDTLFVPQAFSRAANLQWGINSLAPDDLAIVLDIDMNLRRQFFDRCLAFTQQGQMVYFPAVFSYYNPSLWKRAVQRQYEVDPWALITADTGAWRDYGYGMVAGYVSDFRRAGGYNLVHQEWGYEDLDLYEAFTRQRRITILRARDSSISHLWHPKHCDSIEEPKRRLMCERSKMAAESRECNNDPDWCIRRAGGHVSD